MLLASLAERPRARSDAAMWEPIRSSRVEKRPPGIWTILNRSNNLAGSTQRWKRRADPNHDPVQEDRACHTIHQRQNIEHAEPRRHANSVKSQKCERVFGLHVENITGRIAKSAWHMGGHGEPTRKSCSAKIGAAKATVEARISSEIQQVRE